MTERHQPFDRLINLAIGPALSIADAFSHTQDPKRLIQIFMENWRDDIDPSPLLYFQYSPHHGGVFLTELSGVDWKSGSRFIDLSEDKNGLAQLLRSEIPPILMKYLHNNLHTAEFQMFPLLISNEVPPALGGVFVSKGRQGIGSGLGKIYWHLLNLHFQNANLQLKLLRLGTRNSADDLFDKSEFVKQLDIEMARSRRLLHPLSLMLIDIDGVGNDRTLSVQSGTMISRLEHWVSYVLKRTSRTTDCLARLEPGQFAVLMPHTNCAGAVDKAERLQIQLRNSKKFPATVTIAISEYPTLTEDAEGLVRTARDTITGLRKKLRAGGSIGVVKRPAWLKPDFPVQISASMKASV